jgi:WD40 repeat protein
MADMNYNAHTRLSYDLNHFNIRAQNLGGGYEYHVSDVDDGSLLLDLRSEPDSELYTMDIHPIDRKRFITSGSDGTVRLFDLRMIHQGRFGKLGFSVVPRYRQVKGVTGATFDWTGERIAASVIGGNIHVIRTSDATDLSTLPPPPPPPRRGRNVINFHDLLTNEGGIDFERIPGLAARRSMGEDEEEEHVEPGKVTGELIELIGHRSQETFKTCNWFGDFVVTGSDGGEVFFYDVESGKIVNIVKGHRGNVNVVTVHKEKKLLATSGIDHFAVLWEPKLVGKVDVAQIDEDVARFMEEEEDQGGNVVVCTVM